MNRSIAYFLVWSYWLGSMLAAAAARADEQGVFPPDREFIQAVAKGDSATLSKLLDADFSWTDTEGRTRSRAEVLGALPKPALGDETGVNRVRRSRNQMEAILVDRDKIHVLRIWGKRGTEWRLLVYHEVALGRGGMTSSTESSSHECDNPCKGVPYKARNEAEQEILTSWEELETAVAHRDSFAWAPHIANEFVMLGSTNDHALTKADRVATLNLQKVTGRGALPPPVVSAQLFDFGDSAVMTSQHQPYASKALRVTRVWIKRDGKWLMAISVQTTIENSAAKAE